MNNLNCNSSNFCKFEILAELSFHKKTSKDETIKVLCSRLLTRQRLKEESIECDILNLNFQDNIHSFDTDQNQTEELIDNNYKNEPISNEDKHCSEDIIKKKDLNCSEHILSSVGDECSSLEDQFKNLSTNESEHAEWYAYWEKNGEDFVNETWIKQYGSCTLDDLPMDPEELYKKHQEQQYHILYWKFVNEKCATSIEIEENSYDSSETDQYTSNYNKDIDVSNFDFLYKYKHFQQENSKLIKAYRAISIMGYTYDDQNMFESAFVDYLKTNLVKSTRHLNVYRFPKMCCNSFSESNKCEKNSVENKKMLKREELKEKRDKHIVEEMERFGYSYLQNNPKLIKYWKRRYLLFSEFERGIKLDEESWYSVTPELISKHIAERCSCYLIVDPFCGAGGNIIQFAKTCELVIAIDKDPKKIEIARHNAELYGVADRIQFIIGDYFALAPTLKADVVFLSPPWGGVDHMNFDQYKLSYIMPENGGIDNLLNLARKITSNIAIHLPKNTNIFDCLKTVDDGYIEIQQNILNSRYNSITIYFSELYGLCDENTDAYDDNFN